MRTPTHTHTQECFNGLFYVAHGLRVALPQPKKKKNKEKVKKTTNYLFAYMVRWKENRTTKRRICVVPWRRQQQQHSTPYEVKVGVPIYIVTSKSRIT